MTDSPGRELPYTVIRRRRFLNDYFDIPSAKILELGALDMPTFLPDEADISFMDYYSDGEFKALAVEGRLSRPLQDIVPVSYVSKEKYFADGIDSKFDIIIAAHVLEHIPDPLSWLNELSKILTDNGVVFLPIPDRRYTFDYLRRETSPTELLSAMLRDLHEPDDQMILDFLFYKRTIDAKMVWSDPDYVATQIEQGGCTLEEAIRRTKSATGNVANHLNVHCHVYSFESFPNVFKEVCSLDDFRLEVNKVVDVMRESNEFWAVFNKKT